MPLAPHLQIHHAPPSLPSNSYQAPVSLEIRLFIPDSLLNLAPEFYLFPDFVGKSAKARELVFVLDDAVKYLPDLRTPYFQPLRLSNQEVATGLHDRTLVGSSIAICSFCGSDSPLGHDELCRSRHLEKGWDNWKTRMGHSFGMIKISSILNFVEEQ
ncbi:hypothetical protein C367_05585 [Cryptococcus neoformans Ze90-1]|nr:hypothetical protein AYX13_06657 [Cryptococcus neoformans var. grubii]OXG15380.1 hypothetical protein C367_05585 [Cryptococcus neoformans var. grubii Ze90-1]